MEKHSLLKGVWINIVNTTQENVLSFVVFVERVIVVNITLNCTREGMRDEVFPASSVVKCSKLNIVSGTMNLDTPAFTNSVVSNVEKDLTRNLCIRNTNASKKHKSKCSSTSMNIFTKQFEEMFPTFETQRRHNLPKIKYCRT